MNQNRALIRNRRVRHLAKFASLGEDEALVILQNAGYKVRNINDQISLHSVDAAFLLLTDEKEHRSPISQPFIRPDDSIDDFKQNLGTSKFALKNSSVHYLDCDQILNIHNQLVEIFAEEDDPISPSGPKDMGLLESATHRPQTSLSSVEKYPTLCGKAAALFHSLVLNHPFHNGNKRTALVSVVVFLDLNKYTVESTDDELFDFVISTAKRYTRSGKPGTSDDEVAFVESWFRSHSHKVNTQTNNAPIEQFLKGVEAAGGRYRKAANGAWVVWGPKGDKSYNLPRVSVLQGEQIRVVLKRIGLTHGQSGIHYEELTEGVSSEQSQIRRFRNVLRRLANV